MGTFSVDQNVFNQLNQSGLNPATELENSPELSTSLTCRGALAGGLMWKEFSEGRKLKTTKIKKEEGRCI